MKTIDGGDQVKQYSRLYTPDQLGGFRIGDVVDVASLGRCEVVGLLHPSLLQVRTYRGTIVKVGYRACSRVRF